MSPPAATTPQPPATATTRRARLTALLGLLLVVALVAAAADQTLRQQRRELRLDLERQMSAATEGYAEVLATWLAAQRESLERAARNPYLRLYAAEAAAGETLGNIETTHLHALLNDFADDDHLLGLHLARPDGTPFASSATAPGLDEEGRALAREARESAAAVDAPLGGEPLAFVIAVPVPPFQAGEEDVPNGTLVARIGFAEELERLLATHLLDYPRERLHLFQATKTGLRRVGGRDALPPQGVLPFARAPALDGRGESYHLGRPVAGSRWFLVQEVGVAALEEPLAAYRRGVLTAAALLLLTVTLLLLVVWRRQRREASRLLTAQYHDLSERIEEQQRLIGEINGAVEEHITLKGLDGGYRYANRAFCAALGRTPATVVGSDDHALFNSADATALQALEQRALEIGRTVRGRVSLLLGDGLHHFEIAKTPFRNSGDEVVGVVTVAHDITGLMEERRRNETILSQTASAIGALSEVNELPYLVGQTEMIGRMALAIARQMGLPGRALKTVEIAASLCQVGKLALPHEIRFKTGRFTPEEHAAMRNHVANADQVLREIDFGMPVREAVVQMYERLDGSGYPAGLKGEAITLEARILAVANVFIAHTRPRPYRGALSLDAALDHLEGAGEAFDQRVVAALRVLVERAREHRTGRGQA